MNLLIPIKPKYSNMIFRGTKTCEYRRVKPDRDFKRVYVYETAPISAIVGYFDINGIMLGNPDIVWDYTNKNGCLSYDDFHSYFQGCDRAVALLIGNTSVFCKAKKLGTEGFPSVVPQNFIYF